MQAVSPIPARLRPLCNVQIIVACTRTLPFVEVNGCALKALVVDGLRAFSWNDNGDIARKQAYELFFPFLSIRTACCHRLGALSVR